LPTVPPIDGARRTHYPWIRLSRRT